jgi:hypothetical protein
MDFRIRENDGKGFFLTICPWQMPIFGLPSLTLPALISLLIPCNSVANASSLASFPWPMYFYASRR